ncbi:MAG: 4Fe-4S dicluster domain-containing protein [Bacteroidota bacterium]
MSQIDHSMSLTPPSRLNLPARIGALLAGGGIVAMAIAFLSASPVSGWLVLGISGVMLATGGVLWTSKRNRYRNLIYVLFLTGVAGLVFLGVRINLTGWAMFFLIFGLISVGAVLYFYYTFGQGPAGIKNHGLFHSSATRQAGTISWMLAIAFTGFYVVLYWFPDQLFGLVAAADPLYHTLTSKSSYWIDENGLGHVTNQWFVYGLIYTVAVLVMGFRFIMRYRHSRYQIMRTLSVAFFQLVIAFLLPHFMEALNRQQSEDFKPVVGNYLPVYNEYEKAKNDYFAAKGEFDNAPEDQKPALEENLNALSIIYRAEKDTAQNMQEELLANRPTATPHYFSYFWPLDYDILQPQMIEYYTGSAPFDSVHVPYVYFDDEGQISSAGISTSSGFGGYGLTVILIALFMSTVGAAALTYFFGKRWYCSWVCGCGGLAETAGDPFRHQSDKSLKAWRIERISIHSVLVLITLVTALLLIDWKAHFLPEGFKGPMKSGYGFLIGSMFAGVVGTGFYPILGSRVWCRFGCPQAAVLGIFQKYFSRFRITTNGGQCISCGNCSTYCEMGIDVKAYAQRGQNIVRASCVGCGVCSSVCPRGVLNLENGPLGDRINDLEPLSFSGEEVKLKM